LSILKEIKKRINFKHSFIRRSIGKENFALLDVGAGNHSATKITSLFPNCVYYGLDLNKEYSNSKEDFAVMKDFYELDLTKLDYAKVPDHFFDMIVMTHVIEHLHNGDAVLPLLLTKLKPNGKFFIEYPGIKSTKLPSMHGTLNYYDDPTHVRIYSVEELSKIFLANNCEIIEKGIRRNWYYIFLMPVRMIVSLVKIGKLEGNIFWDLLGFAEYLYVKKK
jgi:SAM-dependent methyltransferase